jgi:hypothetical protein
MNAYHNVNEEREEDNARIPAASWRNGPLCTRWSGAADRHEPARIGEWPTDSHDDNALCCRRLYIATPARRERSMRDGAIRYRSHACYLKWPTPATAGQSGYLRANGNTVTHPDHAIACNRNVRTI